MEPTERIHPGGKPSHSHPPVDISKRTVNFYRQVPNNREQSQTEDAVGTEENGAAEENDETEEVVKGTLYQWASNICHLDDTKVKVEDLSDRDIGAQLAAKVQDFLSMILKSDPDKMQVRAYSKSEQFEGPTSEDFVIAGPLGDLRVCRKTYHNIDARNGQTWQYSQSTIAQRISADAAGKVPPAPTGDQLKYVACRILAKDVKENGKLSNTNNRDMWPILRGMAQEELYNHREDDAFLSRLGDKLNGIIQRPADQTPEIVDRVEKKKLNWTKVNPFHEFLLDGEASNACDRIEGFDIVILRDEHYELICGVFSQAVQKLFAAGTVDKMSTAAEAFAWRFPYKAPDDQRHNANKLVHLAKYPDKDVRSKECKQPHFAVCGVVHYGVHHEAGHSNGFDGLCFQTFSRDYKMRGLDKTIVWNEEFPKLKSGVYGVAAKASRLALEAWDPKLYEDYLEVRQHLPDSLNITLASSGENPYGYMAQLVDVLTEGHTDKTDWINGMAALTCFGSFTGKSLILFRTVTYILTIAGGDLVLKELGVRIAFPSGSNCHLRGQGLHHFISGYEGIRHCLVLTNKESVRQTTSNFDGRLKDETERAAKLESKAPTDWTEEEQKLHEAYTEGKNAMLEKIWDRIKGEQREKRGVANSKRANKSKGDRPEEPPKKRAKKTKDTGKAQ